jgi:hypothetical protein
MPVFAIGMDIGREGAAVLIKDRSAIFVLHWHQHVKNKQKVYRLTTASTNSPRACITDGLIGSWGLAEGIYSAVASYCMFAGGRIHIAAEDVYLGVNPGTTIALAKFGGAVVSRLEPFDPTKEATWVRPTIWRKELWNLSSRTPREEAKAISMERIPGMVEHLPQLLDTIGNKGKEHICDAAGVALYKLATTK